LVEFVGIDAIHEVFVGELMLLEFFRDTRLQCAFHRVTCKIERSGISLGIEEYFRLSQALLGDALQVGAVQGLRVRF
jgi:hypothetical protein